VFPAESLDTVWDLKGCADDKLVRDNGKSVAQVRFAACVAVRVLQCVCCSACVAVRVLQCVCCSSCVAVRVLQSVCCCVYGAGLSLLR